MPAKYVLDTNCYIDGDKHPRSKAALETFAYAATPFLYLHAITAAELQMGVPGAVRQQIEKRLIAPFRKRGRIITPSAASWDMLGTTLSWLHEHEGLVLKTVKRWDLSSLPSRADLLPHARDFPFDSAIRD
jgi:hypothetical protein